MSTPQSTIRICSGVRLNSRYDHSIYFADRTAQLNYFAGKVVKTFSAYSFIRKSWDLKVAATMEEAASWSYLFFNNYANGKTYFYFIDNIEYVNDGTVLLKLQIDVLQTYLFDFDFLPSFVERQHTTTDAIGDHTVEEGLELGEMTSNGAADFDVGAFCIMVMCTTNPNAQTKEQAVNALPYLYNNVFSGIKIWAVDASRWAAWGNQLETLTEIGVIDSIVSMWMYPKQLVKLAGEATFNGDDLAVPVEAAYTQQEAKIVYNTEKNNAKIDGYTPRNKKLLTYPFNFLYMTDNAGTSAVYRYERCADDSMTFVMSGALTPDGGVHLTPRNYNKQALNYHEGMTVKGFPTCAWNSDTYKLWLAQNQNSNAFSMGMAGLKIIGGIAATAGSGGVLAAAGGGAAIASGFADIVGQLAQRADRDIQPPQAKGSYSNSVNITNGKLAFSFVKQSVNAERAKIIDDFFTMYGYKLNRVQTPNIHARSAFTYVKTIGCHIAANLCNEDATKIESIFDHGVTFWTNGDRIGNYADANNTL